MFKTERHAQLLHGLAILFDDAQYWSYVGIELMQPLFLMEITEIVDGEEFREAVLAFPSSIRERVEQTLCTGRYVDRIQILTPHHMNQTERWMMEPLLEIVSFTNENSIEIGQTYQVGGGRIYSMGEISEHEKKHCCAATIYSVNRSE
ncbi:hypothetical protein [Pseudomonas matsuisoli]|uniref:Uncharacterized protein n=1 Tax=Pseudomonas matsuisoli TaxID=1515666 RepID=A0A917UV35_9PSED|nr:hypothetical protein [Pseudomonas matsuisoli]GGJ86880.1 hypothetical protein GCM10009304_11130 [Pseudomonas matsuisoli]